MVFGVDLTSSGTGFIIATFLIGLLLGVVVKKVFKLALAIVALVVVLVVTGYVNLSLTQDRQQTIYRTFSSSLPTVLSKAEQVTTLLPLTSVAFLGGIAIGLWKG